MIELLILFGVICLGGFLLIGLLKLCVMLILIPVKIAFALAKGILGLLIVVPLLALVPLILAGIAPVILAVLCLPLIAGVALVGGLLRWIFCL